MSVSVDRRQSAYTLSFQKRPCAPEHVSDIPLLAACEALSKGSDTDPFTPVSRAPLADRFLCDSTLLEENTRDDSRVNVGMYSQQARR